VSNPISLILLVLFGLSVLITYMIIRRTRIRIIYPAIIGSIVDVLLFGLFSLSVGNVFVQAVVVGLVLGILFNLVTVSAAAFFRQNETTQSG
jgi:hypothetical protein